MVRKYTELTEYIYAPDMPVAPGMEHCEADRKAGLKLFDGFDFIFIDGAFVVLTCSSQTVSLPLRLSLLPVFHRCGCSARSPRTPACLRAAARAAVISAVDAVLRVKCVSRHLQITSCSCCLALPAAASQCVVQATKSCCLGCQRPRSCLCCSGLHTRQESACSAPSRARTQSATATRWEARNSTLSTAGVNDWTKSGALQQLPFWLPLTQLLQRHRYC